MSTPTSESVVFETPRHGEWEALATFELSPTVKNVEGFARDLAIGQSLGTWAEGFAPLEELKRRVARVVGITPSSKKDQPHSFTVSFPLSLWHGRLDWLVKIVFGKMSFVEGVNWTDLTLKCGSQNSRKPPFSFGPAFPLTESLPSAERAPLLMGILKPAVALSDEVLCGMIREAGHAGVNIVKDDEIRHDASLEQVLRRVERVAKALDKDGLNLIYAVHFQNFSGDIKAECRQLENAGARALLMSPWIDSFHTLQQVSHHSQSLILSHPALVGSFHGSSLSPRIHPRVSLGSLPRFAGAHLSLFPSPYGSIGLPLEEAQEVAAALEKPYANEQILPTWATPSAGIKPQHAPLALRDFGPRHVLNAGTALFSWSNSDGKDPQTSGLISQNAAQFKKEMMP